MPNPPQGPKPAPPKSPAAQGRAAALDPPPPTHRLLRGYASDPSLATRLDTALVSEVTYKVPWEPLTPGPCGRYVEVVDYDPPSQCFYPPVDLDHPHVLAQNGLAPSEGTPEFHQQMVYAVAMTTIQRFERVLGRRAFWSNPYDESRSEGGFVEKLRIYPHAMRMPNAYYSREKRALLFGYFPATEDRSSGQYPGGMTFTCLSHDIIAHETTHALLDGFHEHFLEATNPDVLAFHEAFADIVALFQHFTFPTVLAHQLAKTRGDLRNENLLAQLATQFGQARGHHGALRDAIGRWNPEEQRWLPHVVDPTELERKFEVHERGAVLVAAVFDAFLSIYESRTADLRRLATGGSGLLGGGALQPDLVNRLAAEAARAATHVLTMCIRALDYCPPVDLTFGDYLRALITADMDLMPEDAHQYRVAFIEAFRRRGIYPSDVRTLGEDSLRWTRPEEEAWIDPIRVTPILQELIERSEIDRLRYLDDREEIWKRLITLRTRIHGRIRDAVRKQRVLERLTGLSLTQHAAPPGVRVRPDGIPKFQVYSLRESRRERDDGKVLNQVFLTLLQTLSVEKDGVVHQVRGGSTLVFDMNANRITYVIAKGLNDEARIRRVIDYYEGRQGQTALADTYFGPAREPFAALHTTGA